MKPMACLVAAALACSCSARAMPRWPPSRAYHVENYQLRLHFSQSRGEVFSDEVVTIRPFAAALDRLCINSTGLTIDSVTLLAAATAPEALAHTIDDHCLWITLDRPHGPADSLDIRIVYHGRPRIGLFFVNPDRNDPDAPREIYTQGAGAQSLLVPVLGLPQRHGQQRNDHHRAGRTGGRLERQTDECEARRRPG